MIEEDGARDRQEAEAVAERKRKESEQGCEIERVVNEYTEDCAEGSDFDDFSFFLIFCHSYARTD